MTHLPFGVDLRTILPSPTRPVIEELPPLDDLYLCKCGKMVDRDFDASYICDIDKEWHCADCHFSEERNA